MGQRNLRISRESPETTVSVESREPRGPMEGGGRRGIPGNLWGRWESGEPKGPRGSRAKESMGIQRV